MIKIVINPKTPRAVIAALVTQALEETGDHPILVGGAVVGIYTKGRYVSDDLDIVSYRATNNSAIKTIMEKLGFASEMKGMHWVHPNTDIVVQFLVPPAMVGERPARLPSRLPTKAGELPMYSPLDSACDRLAWVLQGDQQSMRQCVDIVVEQNVSLGDIADWLTNELGLPREKQRAMSKLTEQVERRRARLQKKRAG